MGNRRMRFITWAKKDIEDKTPIKYTLFEKKSGKLFHYTSEDIVSFSTLERIRYAWIDRISYFADENGQIWWDVYLYED